jgi:hypothetical protein
MTCRAIPATQKLSISMVWLQLLHNYLFRGLCVPSPVPSSTSAAAMRAPSGDCAGELLGTGEAVPALVLPAEAMGARGRALKLARTASSPVRCPRRLVLAATSVGPAEPRSASFVSTR